MGGSNFVTPQVGEPLEPESGLILITGGCGVVGHRVALRLLNSGYPRVRLGTMAREKVASLNKLGAEIADFAWNLEETYTKALQGVKSVLCTIPYTQEWDQHFPAFLEACKKAGVKHFVKLSFYHARMPGDPMQEIPLVRAHGACDDLVIKSLTPESMSYTILYSSHYMSNPLVFQGKELRSGCIPGTFFGATHNHMVNYVSPNDVAEVATRVLLESHEHHNKEYTLTGPEAIFDQQVAGLLSKHLKKPIMYVDQPLHEYTTEIQHGGDAAWMVEDLVAMEKVKATGIEEKPDFKTDDIDNICGHKAETFEEYLQRTDMMTLIEMGRE